VCTASVVWREAPPGGAGPSGRAAGPLLEFRLEDWLPLVDVSKYDPDHYRDRRNFQPVGPVKFLFEDWQRQVASELWSRARLNWAEEYGWPGGLDYIEVLQQTVQLRRTASRDR
jgi:hypothetical protein